MRVLVCGGRYFSDHIALGRALIPYKPKFSMHDASKHIIIHGAAPGADKLADEWCDVFGCRKRVFPANWIKHGKAAGPIRNQRMIDEGCPDLVLAFPGGAGTADMVRRARSAGIKVREIPPANPQHGSGT